MRYDLNIEFIISGDTIYLISRFRKNKLGQIQNSKTLYDQGRTIITFISLIRNEGQEKYHITAGLIATLI
jgi:hypothetical protein